MRTLQNKIVTGYESREPLIIIEKGGADFYYFENPRCKRITFNLPEGNYSTFNDVRALRRPLRYICPKLPKREKYQPVKNTDVYFNENPNKATIIKSWNNADIFLDESYLHSPVYMYFLLGHELGHYYYFTEWKCDVFSVKNMCANGFNPSQCIYSENLCLSDRTKNDKRKDLTNDYIKKIICYE